MQEGVCEEGSRPAESTKAGSQGTPLLQLIILLLLLLVVAIVTVVAVVMMVLLHPRFYEKSDNG